MMVIAPAAARAKVAEIVPVDATTADFTDSSVRLIAVPGTDDREFALEITGADGTTLVLNDLVGNIHDAKGLGGWFLRFMNFAGNEPHIPKPVKWKLIHNTPAFKHQLLGWADMPRLKRVIVSHGSIIDGKPSEVLRGLAASLS